MPNSRQKCINKAKTDQFLKKGPWFQAYQPGAAQDLVDTPLQTINKKKLKYNNIFM